MKEFVIMGYEFSNEKLYHMAKQELEEILKLKNQFDVSSYKGCLDFYNSLMDKKLNRTPIGLEYMRNIQKDLIKNSKIKSDVSNVMIEERFDENAIRDRIKSRDKRNNAKALEKNMNKYKELYVKMIIINIILIATIITMFIISKKSEKYDVDYFKESIENDYLDWEKNLEERESSIEAIENMQDMQ